MMATNMTCESCLDASDCQYFRVRIPQGNGVEEVLIVYPEDKDAYKICEALVAESPNFMTPVCDRCGNEIHEGRCLCLAAARDAAPSDQARDAESDDFDDIPACPYCGAMAGVCSKYPNCPSGPKT